MKLIFSRVPHLARAIAEKKRSQSRSTLHRPPLSSIVELSKSRTFSSTTCRSQRSTLSTPPSPAALRPRFNVRPPPTIPKVPDQPNENAERNDPAKDPKTVRRYLMGVSLFGAVLGTYIVYVYTTYKISIREYDHNPSKLSQNADVTDRWWDAKRNFDYEVEGQEKVMWMKAKRRRLIREAYGDVLEVSAGTGRNMDLYDTRPYSASEDSSYGRDRRHMITSLTFNDQSPVMIDRAQKKWKTEQKRKREGDRFQGEIQFITGDAGLSGVIPRPAGGYDTIVQTMGVCSMPRPVEFLRHLGRLVRQPGEHVINSSPEKFRKQEEEDGNGGRIFLLEHGRGYEWASWLNQYLDNTAAMHADRYGCWFNKDIGKVVEDSGLVVERIKRYHFGTTWEIVLRPAPGPPPDDKKQLDPVPPATVGSRSWWSSFWR